MNTGNHTAQLSPSSKSALIIVDMQNSFVEGDDPNVHSLAVQGGRELIPAINALQAKFDLIVATQDWHPQNHGSFASQYPDKQPFDITTLSGVEQILWPDHCVQNTQGAEFVPHLDTARIQHITQKGTNPLVDSYSGFKDNNSHAYTDLNDYLKSHSVSDIYVAGLAADFCVKFTAIDGAELGYTTYFVQDLTKAVNPSESNLKQLYAELTQHGVQVIHSEQIL